MDDVRAAIGRPPAGLDPELRRRLAYVLDRVGGVAEAHAPAFRMEGEKDEPRLDLFVLFARGAVAQEKVKAIHDELRFQLPPGAAYRIWTPGPDEPLLAAMREAGCQVWPTAPHEALVLEKETRIQIGRPANPIPEARVAELGRRLGQVPGVEAAYLPMMFGLPGQERPAQVLFLQVAKGSDRDRVGEAVAQAVAAAGVGPIDCLQLRAGDGILETARGTGCVVPMAPAPGKPKGWRSWLGR